MNISMLRTVKILFFTFFAFVFLLTIGCGVNKAISAEVTYISLMGGRIIDVYYIVITREYDVSREYTVTINIDGNKFISTEAPIRTDYPLIGGMGMEYDLNKRIDIIDTPKIKRWYDTELINIQTQLDKLEHDYHDLEYKAVTDKKAWLNVNTMNDYDVRLNEIQNKMVELQGYRDALQSGSKTDVTSKLSRFITFEISVTAQVK